MDHMDSTADRRPDPEEPHIRAVEVASVRAGELGE